MDTCPEISLINPSEFLLTDADPDGVSITVTSSGISDGPEYRCFFPLLNIRTSATSIYLS